MHLEPILAETRRAVEARKKASHRSSLEGARRSPQATRLCGCIAAKIEIRAGDHRRIEEGFAPPKGSSGLSSMCRFWRISGARRPRLASQCLPRRSSFRAASRTWKPHRRPPKSPACATDFYHRRFQILEARAHRADAILLIARSIDRLPICAASMMKPIGLVWMSSARSILKRNSIAWLRSAATPTE